MLKCEKCFRGGNIYYLHTIPDLIFKDEILVKQMSRAYISFYREREIIDRENFKLHLPWYLYFYYIEFIVISSSKEGYLSIYSGEDARNVINIIINLIVNLWYFEWVVINENCFSFIENNWIFPITCLSYVRQGISFFH